MTTEKKRIEFNWNDTVRVRLSAEAHARLVQDHVDLWRRAGRPVPRYYPPQEDAEGWSKWQLWRLMQELGPHIGLEASMLVGGVIEFEVEP